eukprot:1146276-Pelagomonas_calceolata.AAC.5
MHALAQTCKLKYMRSASQASEGCSYEPFFNGALLSFKLGDLQEAFNQAFETCNRHHSTLFMLRCTGLCHHHRGAFPAIITAFLSNAWCNFCAVHDWQVTKSLELFPEHHESQELRKQLKAQFTML